MVANPLHVFVSHADRDRDIALALRAWIEDTFLGGVKVFVSSDGESILPGDDWRAKVEDSLSEANVVLVVSTQHSLSRPWVGFEAGAGWARGAKVVPLCYHGVTPANLPTPYSARQGLDLGNENDQRRLAQLLAVDAHFDVARISEKPLLLPERKSAEDESGATLPDVRVKVRAARTAEPGAGFDGAPLSTWKPILLVKAENHGKNTVFLGSCLAADLEVGGRAQRMVFHHDARGLPILRYELQPGDAHSLPIDPRDLLEEGRRASRIYFTDEIEREFAAPEAEFDRALTEWKAMVSDRGE